MTLTTTQQNDIILVGVAYNSNYLIAVPTSPGLTFQQLGNQMLGGSLGVALFYAIASTPQQYTISVGYQSTFNNLGIVVSSFYGENVNSPFDGSVVSTQGSNSAPTLL